jgi:hypothetical protein
VVAVEIIGDLEGQEGTHAHRHGTQHLVADTRNWS